MPAVLLFVGYGRCIVPGFFQLNFIMRRSSLMDTAVLVALGIDAELIVLAGQDGVEGDAGDGGDGQAGQA